MSELDFHVDYNIEVPELSDEVQVEAEQRLRALAEDKKDMIGASVALEDIAGVENTFLYEARIVAYIKPKNIAVTAKHENPDFAMKDALSAIEQKIKAERERFHETWQRSDLQTDVSLYELSAREIYQAYVDQPVTQEMIASGRDKVASKLMLAEKMPEEDAYYAADRILEYSLEPES